MHSDVIVVGAGHNGLVSAILLSRAGLKVTVLEPNKMMGGAVRTEYPHLGVGCAYVQQEDSL